MLAEVYRHGRRRARARNPMVDEYVRAASEAARDYSGRRSARSSGTRASINLR